MQHYKIAISLCIEKLSHHQSPAIVVVKNEEVRILQGVVLEHLGNLVFYAVEDGLAVALKTAHPVESHED